jgi:hypothetical protein
MVESKFDQGSLESMRRERRREAARQLESQRLTSQVQPAAAVIKPRITTSREEKSKSPKKAIFLPECPVCQARVENLNKHYAKHHLGRRVLDAAELKNARQLIQEGKCPFCEFKKGNQALLLQHLTNVHGVIEAKQFSKVQMTSIAAVAENYSTKDSLFSTATVEKSVLTDGQHLASQAFRDNGQFGSYPLHDAMDDESSA